MLQTRKDLLQAHRLMTRRAALALLQAEPDPPDQPLRRLNVSAFSSVLVAVIVAAVFGIWGLIAPGHAEGLTAPETLLIDKATGTPFIACQDGKLCPVVNYASARLALNTASPNQREVTQASLARYPRGPEIGIEGLPALPAASMLVGQPWSVCVQTETSAATLASHTMTTLVGGQDVGGRPMSAGDALVVAAGGDDWLVWNGERMLIPPAQRTAVLTALGFVQAAEQVPLAWLNAFSQGPDFAPPKIIGFGRRVARGPAGGPARIGQVFVTSPGARQSYVLTRHGLVPITVTEAKLLEAIPGQPRQTTVTTAQAAEHHGSVSADGMPLTMPAPADRNISPSAPLCVVYSGPASSGPVAGRVTVGGRVPANGLAITGASYVNQIAMRPGSAALVAMVPGLPSSPSASSPAAGGQRPDVTSYFLVTGGVRYGLAGPGVAAMLGYNLARQQTLVPASVVEEIPRGPAFDPAVARDPVSG
jgi:type VII secretion protein EccB